MDKIIDIGKLIEFYLLKKEVEEFKQRNKFLKRGSGALKHLVENLKDTVITTFQDKKYANDVRK